MAPHLCLADEGLSSDARQSVLAAHLAICKFKAGA